MSALSIAVPTALSAAPLSSASSSPTGRYIPVHRRTASTSSTSSVGSRSSCSSRDSSVTRASSYGSECSESSTTESRPHPLIYSRDALLNLAKSPLSRFSAETRESLRNSVPEIVTNRKQRKAIEYHNTQAAKQQRQALKQQKEVTPIVPLHIRRSRPVGKENSEKKKNPTTSTVGEDTQWRGRRPTAVPTPVPI